MVVALVAITAIVGAKSQSLIGNKGQLYVKQQDQSF